MTGLLTAHTRKYYRVVYVDSTLILTFEVIGTMLIGLDIIETLLNDLRFINIVQRVSVLGSFRWTYTIGGHLGRHLEL